MHLTRREKQLVIAAGFLLVLVGAYRVAVQPKVRRLAVLERVVTDKQKTLPELHAKIKECESLRERLARISEKIPPQSRDFPVRTFLEGEMKACGLPQKAAMKRKTSVVDETCIETRVEITLQRASEKQITDFLRRVRKNARVRLGVRSLTITRVRNAPLKAEVTIATLAAVEKSRMRVPGPARPAGGSRR